MKRRAFVEVRRGRSDSSVTVQLVPEGTTRLRRLDRVAAARLGITFIFCGRGDPRGGPRSKLKLAIREAEMVARNINGE